MEIIDNQWEFITDDELNDIKTEYSLGSYKDHIRDGRFSMQDTIQLLILKGYFAALTKEDIMTNSKLQQIESAKLYGSNTYYQLKIFPKNIIYLRSLKELVLEGFYLTKILDSLFKLDLNYLDLSKNYLTSIPDSIEDLKNLTELNLSYNRLKLLPDSIGNLENLKTIIIEHNRMKKLPIQITRIKSLNLCFIANNRIMIEPNAYSWSILSKFFGLDRQYVTIPEY